MAKESVAQIPSKLYELLSPLTAEERARVVKATLVLFGDDIPVGESVAQGKQGFASAVKTSGPVSDVAKFVNEKDPQNKGELLAVAARYRELVEQQESHSKADLKAVVTGAHRNFDDRNFARDMNNARRQAGFFILGSGRDASKLSYYGKQYIDALPDRAAASKISRPKIGGKKGSVKKKSQATK